MTDDTAPGLRPSIVILIPVLARHHRVRPLVESVRQTSDARIVFVCSPGDDSQLAACRESGEEVMIASWEPDRGDYARKINLGFRETTEEWVFCGADDLVFHPGWDTNAVKMGETRNAGVVGTQDNGNPSVIRGRQSTHSLVRRSYIVEQGGTFDGTGEIYSEVYDHQMVDVELVEAARRRGRWAFSHNSIVEHRHPHWGKAEMDDTYVKATRETREDMLLFQQRMRQFRNTTRKRHGVALY